MEHLHTHATHPHSPAVSPLPNLVTVHPTPSDFLSAPYMKRATILLVDDDPDILSITRALLEMEGYRVTAFSNPTLAAKLFKPFDRVDLLITDYQMPELSGLELARELALQQPALPVLVVSASMFSISMETEMRERRWRFLSKPWQLPALLSSVHEALSGPRDGQTARHEGSV